MKSLSAIFSLLVLGLLLHGCKGELPLSERTLLEITSEPLANGVVLDLLRVRSVEGQGSQSHAVLVAERPLVPEEGTSDLAIVFDLTAWVASRSTPEVNLEVLGLSDGQVHARFEGLISIDQPGVISLKMLSIDGQCDGDADGYVDCSMPGCCEESRSPFTDCSGANDAAAPGQEEVCDGLDNDCDGETDEGVLNLCGACGEVPEEVCDAVDNDCDGETDEGFSWAGLALGTDCKGYGGCGAETGVVVCDLALEVPTCSSMLATHPDSLLATETCNGIDDDCDGETDETEAPGEPCGEGACAGGTVTCYEGSPVCSSTLEGHVDYAASDETCNGIDDDCDGETDETGAPGEPCGEGACAGGTVTCYEGSPVCSSTLEGHVDYAASDETCNGIDDDCDGALDEDFAVDTLLVDGGQGQVSVGGACDGVDGDECLDGVVVCDVMSPGKATCSESTDPIVAYVFSGGSAGIQAYDVSNPLNPSWISSTSAASLGGVFFTTGIYRDGLLYVADSWFGGLGMAIVDLSDPSNPALVGQYILEEPSAQYVSSVTVVGDLAYVGVHTCHEPWTGTGGDYAPCVQTEDLVYDGGLHVVDISDVSNPTVVSAMAWTGDEGPPWPQDIEIVDGIAYVAGRNGLITIDVTDPYDLKGLDIHDPWSKAYCTKEYTTESDIAACSNWGAASRVEIVDGRAYLSGGTIGLMVIDVSKPDDLSWVGFDLPPKKEGSLTNSLTLSLTVHDGFAFAANGNAGLSIHDLSVPFGLNLGNSLVGSFAPPTGSIDAMGVRIVGETAFVASHDGALYVVDVSNPMEPVQVGVDDSGPFGIWGLVVDVPAETAVELCDQADNDCDGFIDEGCGG